MAGGLEIIGLLALLAGACELLMRATPRLPTGDGAPEGAFPPIAIGDDLAVLRGRGAL